MPNIDVTFKWLGILRLQLEAQDDGVVIVTPNRLIYTVIPNPELRVRDPGSFEPNSGIRYFVQVAWNSSLAKPRSE
jgi:hypothetical protein